MFIRQETLDKIYARNYKKETKELMLDCMLSIILNSDCYVEDPDTHEKLEIEEFLMLSPKEYSNLRSTNNDECKLLRILKEQVFAVIMAIGKPEATGCDKYNLRYIKTKNHYYKFHNYALIVDGIKTYMYDAVNICFMLIGRKPFTINGGYEYINRNTTDAKWVNKQRGVCKMHDQNINKENLINEDDTVKRADESNENTRYMETSIIDGRTILIPYGNTKNDPEDIKRNAIKNVAIKKMIDMLDDCIYPQKLPFNITTGSEKGSDVLILSDNNSTTITTKNVSIAGIENLISRYQDIFRTACLKELLLPEEEASINNAICRMKEFFIENYNDYFILNNDIVPDEYMYMIESKVRYYKTTIQSKKILDEWLKGFASSMSAAPSTQLIYGDNILTNGYELSSNSILILFIMDIEKGFVGIFSYFNPHKIRTTLDSADANCSYLVKYDAGVDTVKEVLRRIYKEFSYSIIRDYVDLI